MSGKVPPFYKCYKCHQGGHWVSNCPLNNQDLRKSTGIPSKFLIEVDDPNAPGVMITATGKYVVFRQSLVMGENTQAKVRPKCPEKPPEELICLICKDLMHDAVLTPCCVSAFCDDCIRNHLLDSEDHVCPICNKRDVSLDSLVPNRYLRMKILQFGNQFLTELPKENTSRISSPAMVFCGSRPSTPQESPRSTNHNSPKIIISPRNSPKSLSEIQQEVEDERDVEKIDKKIMNLMKYEEEDNLTEPLRGKGSHEEEEFSSPLKGKKHSKKSKKKKDGEAKEKKHKKKDKEKDKKKKNKKKGKDEIYEDSLNTSHEEGISSALMNEAICPQFNPAIPPPGAVLPIQAVPSTGYLGGVGPYPSYVPPLQIPGNGRPMPGNARPMPGNARPMPGNARPMPGNARPIPGNARPMPCNARPMPGNAIQTHPANYPHYATEQDPLTTFERYLKEKDELRKKRLRSQSSSRSPPYRGRSRSRPRGLRSYSRSRSRTRSPSWDRKGGPISSRRRYSPSPPSSRHGYRSVSRERSHSSFSRSPPSRMRLKQKNSSPTSNHAYSTTYSPDGLPKEVREKQNYGENSHGSGYQYNAYPNKKYDGLSNLNYGSRLPERENYNENRSHRYPYEGASYNAFIESAPVDPAKDVRRTDSLRRVDDKRNYEDRHRSREDEYKRRRDEDEYRRKRSSREKRRSRSKDRHHYEHRRRTAVSPESHKGKKDYESPRNYHPQESKGYKRDDRSERKDIGRDSKRSRSISPREDRKGRDIEKRGKGSREKENVHKESDKDKKKQNEKEHEKVKEKDEKFISESSEKIKESVRKDDKPIRESLEKEKNKEDEKEKKKHEKKKKKKDKRRASQTSVEGSGISETTGEDEEKKKRKKEKKKLKSEKIELQEGISLPTSTSESELSHKMVSSQELIVKGEASLSSAETSEKVMHSSEDSPFFPALSKWERDEDEIFSPSKVISNQEKKEENLVTSDVIRRAENALFSKGLSNRSLISRKVYLEKNKEKEVEPNRTPTPEWERVDAREAKKKGSSIQITISSKTESQIGRPKMGKHELETEKKIDSNLFEISSTENSAEEYKQNSIAVKKRDHSVSAEDSIAKKPRLIDDQPNIKTTPEISEPISSTSHDGHAPKDNIENSDYPVHDTFIQQENQGKEISSVNINSKLSDEHVISTTEEIKKDQIGDNKESIIQFVSEKENKGISPNQTTLLKENVDSEPEEGELIEDSNLEEAPDSTYQTHDKKMEPDSSLGDELSQTKNKDESSSTPDVPQINDLTIENKFEDFGPGGQSSLLLSPPSPTIKRSIRNDKQKDKKIKKRRKRSSSPSSSSSSSSSSSLSSSSSEEEDEMKKKKKKKRKTSKRKRDGNEDNSGEEMELKRAKKKKKKDKKKKKKKEKRRKVKE